MEIGKLDNFEATLSMKMPAVSTFSRQVSGFGILTSDPYSANQLRADSCSA